MLKEICRHGEVGSVNIETIKQEQACIKELLARFQPEDHWNVDKSGPLRPYHVRAYPRPRLPGQSPMLGVVHPVAARRSTGAPTVAASLDSEEDPLKEGDMAPSCGA